MTQKFLSNLIDAAGGELPMANATLLAATLLTWQKLSQTQRIPLELALTEELAQSPREAENFLVRLAESFQADVFREAAKRLNYISQPAARQMLKMAILLGQQGLLDTYDLSDLATINSGTRGESPFLPPEVCDLLVKIGSDQGKANNVYLPWDGNGQLFGRFLKQGVQANIEVINPQGKFYAELIQACYEPSHGSQIKVSDPISSPSYTEKGVLTKFDLVIATPPFGVKVDFERHANDPFNRFPEKSNSLSVLAIRHALKQSKGRTLVVVTNSVLFAAGGEKRLRKDLLEAGLIEAVIALPAGLLSGIAIAFSILVLNKEQLHDRVRLINCDSDKFKSADSRTRFKLANLDDIVNLALDRAESLDLQIVHRDELFRNDMNLLPSRYVMDDAMSRIDTMLSAYRTLRLEEQAAIIRPGLSTHTDDPIPAFEVGAQDIQNSGYLDAPQKRTEVSGFPKNETPFLRPLDIVIVIKGSVGKVSIAPTDTPPPGPGGWVVGQTIAVIRNEGGVDPRALVVFLRSDLGQELIRRLVAGAAIPFIQTRELRQLKIPVLNAEQEYQAIEVLERQQEVNREMLRLKNELESIQMSAWQLPSSDQKAAGR